MSQNSCDQAFAQLASIKEMLKAVENAADDEREAAEQAIYDDPLEVSVRCASWGSPYDHLEPDEYRILLCTGGPAVQITGDLNEHMQPVTARLQHQDWFEPWETLSIDDQDNEALLTYAYHFFPY